MCIIFMFYEFSFGNVSSGGYVDIVKIIVSGCSFFEVEYIF